MLSSDAGSKPQSDKKGDPETSEIVLTPGQKVVAASRLTFWFGVAVFASACGYYIIKELLPTYVYIDVGDVWLIRSS